MLDGFAPSDYGFTIVRLEPDAGVRDIHLRLRGHADAADAGLSFGFVVLRNGVPRYSPVTESLDQEVQLTLRAGSSEVYLVVVGTPTQNHAHGSAAGFGEVARYPYEFRVAGRRVADDAPSPPRRAVTGTPTAAAGWTTPRRSTRPRSSGPDAVVRGDAQVLGAARIEGRAWVEAGAVVEGERRRARRRARPVVRAARRHRARGGRRGRRLHLRLRDATRPSIPPAGATGGRAGRT